MSKTYILNSWNNIYVRCNIIVDNHLANSQVFDLYESEFSEKILQISKKTSTYIFDSLPESNKELIC